MEINITPQPKPSVNRRLMVTATNLGFMVLAILGTIFDYRWAWNLTAFFCWAFTILTVWLFSRVANNAETRAKFFSDAPEMPLKVVVWACIAAGLLFVAYGHWFYALMWFFRLLIYVAIYHVPREGFSDSE